MSIITADSLRERVKTFTKPKVLAGGLIVATVMVGSTTAQSPDPPSILENKVEFTSAIFNTFGDDTDLMRNMQERLQDPEQRAALREEHRAYIVTGNCDVAEVLGLDAATHNKLIDLLTDQQMTQLEDFYVRGFSRAPSAESHVLTLAERDNQQIDALRELLGEAKAARYQAFRLTLAERWQVRELDAYLKTSDKLNPTQKERLIELYRAPFHGTIQAHQSIGRPRSLPGTDTSEMRSAEYLQRLSQLMTIESNEDMWRRAPESDRWLREQAAAFLTASQLSALEKLQADKHQQQQQSIEQMRVQAGLSPSIPAETEAGEPAAVIRDVRVRIKVVVNDAKPASFTKIVSSGTSFTFEIHAGLFLQATPVVDNDTYHLRIQFLEQGTQGKRLIGVLGRAGMLSRVPRVDDELMDTSDPVLAGSKDYAVELSTSVEPV